MKKLIGSPGTVSGLLLRVGQCGFAAASIAIMVSSGGFSSYTAFCYLIASMGLQLLWSLGLACLDMYALRRKRDLHNPVLVSLFVVGDWKRKILNLEEASSIGVVVGAWALIGILPGHLAIMAECQSERRHEQLPVSYDFVTGMLSLAAACSSAGVIILYARDLHFCKAQATLPCHRFEISVILAFVTWFLIGISSHVMFWILASV